MNLSKLFELQRQLDEHIEREHSQKDGENRFEKKNSCLASGVINLNPLTICKLYDKI